MPIREYNKNIEFLLPKKLKDYVNPDDNCLLVERVVNSMKKTKIYRQNLKEYNKKHQMTAGNKAYSMEMMLTIILAGAIDGIFQSRKLAKAIKRDVAYIYLTGEQTPDHSTISRFKNKYQDLIKCAFETIVEIAKEENMLNLSRIAIDGSKYKANAGLNNKIVANEDFLPEEALNRLFNVDKEDDDAFGEDSGDELPENLKSQEQIDEFVKKTTQENINNEMEFTTNSNSPESKIEEAKKEAIATENNKVSITDKEAKLMKINKNSGFFVNVQHAVDGNHFIIGLDVNNSTNDYDSFIPIYEQVQENVGGLPEDCQVLADNGYSNDFNIKFCEDNEIDAYIQTRANATIMNGKTEIGDFSLFNFVWDEEKQGYWCPNKELLTYQGLTPKSKKEIYYTTKCSQCSHKEQCTPKMKYKRIYNKFTPEQKRMIDKMNQEDSQTIYSHRMGMVEHTFGHDKQNLKNRQVDHRGLEKIKTEKLLHAINYNGNRFIKLKKEENIGNLEAKEKAIQTTIIQYTPIEINQFKDYMTHANDKLWNNQNFSLKTNILTVNNAIA